MDEKSLTFSRKVAHISCVFAEYGTIRIYCKITTQKIKHEINKINYKIKQTKLTNQYQIKSKRDQIKQNKTETPLIQIKHCKINLKRQS